MGQHQFVGSALGTLNELFLQKKCSFSYPIYLLGTRIETSRPNSSPFFLVFLQFLGFQKKGRSDKLVDLAPYWPTELSNKRLELN